jgi:hypothetical protein
MSTYSVYSQSLSLSKRKREPKWQSRMSNPERTEVAIKNEQPRGNRSGNQEWATQREPKWQSRMSNPERTEVAIKNEQPREVLNIGHTRRRQTKQQKTQHRKLRKRWATTDPPKPEVNPGDREE